MSWQFESQVSEVIQQTHDIKSFRFPVSTGGVRFEAGQFFFITIKINGADAIHHFSFSNSPTDEGYIEFTKRITPSEFSQALDAMKPGAPAVLRGPEGTFTLSFTQHRLAFLSGGIGITPLRSMLRLIVARISLMMWCCSMATTPWMTLLSVRNWMVWQLLIRT